MTVARDLAKFFVRTSYEDLSPIAVERAKIAIANTIASAANGFDRASVRVVRSLVKESGGPPEATVWFEPGIKAHALDVARVNAMMSDAAASDDSHMRAFAHIGTVTVATALSMGERMHAKGKDVLCAIVVGYECSGRIGDIIAPMLGRRGFHNCVITAFGAVVAASKVLDLNENQMANAIALTATTIGGLGLSTNSSAREYHAGNSAMAGINAALAAHKGFAAVENTLEARRGFFETFGGKVNVEAVTKRLEEEWHIVTDMSLKLMPGAHQNHALAEAASNAAKAGRVSLEEVKRITVISPRRGRDALRQLHPKDFVGAIHSLPYFIAASVADKDFSWHHVSMEKISDPDIGMLQDKVRFRAIPRKRQADFFDGGSVTVRDGAATIRGGTVTITTKSGKEYSSTVEWPKGSPREASCGPMWTPSIRP